VTFLFYGTKVRLFSTNAKKTPTAAGPLVFLLAKRISISLRFVIARRTRLMAELFLHFDTQFLVRTPQYWRVR